MEEGNGRVSAIHQAFDAKSKSVFGKKRGTPTSPGLQVEVQVKPFAPKDQARANEAYDLYFRENRGEKSMKLAPHVLKGTAVAPPKRSP